MSTPAGLCAIFFAIALFASSPVRGEEAAPRQAQAAEDPVQKALDAASAEAGKKTAGPDGAAPVTREDASSASPAGHNPEDDVDKSTDPENAGPEQAVYPGVRNARLVVDRPEAPKVSLWYPVFGQPEVDRDIHAYVERELRDYEQEVELPDDEEKPSNYAMWDCTGFYTLERPNPDVVSLTFNIYLYSGGAHGNLVISSRNYDLKSGRRLYLSDLFSRPEKALEIMADLSPEKLRQNMGDDADSEMIHDGTTPEPRNFENLTLTPGGLFIEFQPYQVGPWSVGPQRVELSLAELAPAGPNPAVWPSVKDTPDPGMRLPGSGGHNDADAADEARGDAGKHD